MPVAHHHLKAFWAEYRSVVAFSLASGIPLYIAAVTNALSWREAVGWQLLIDALYWLLLLIFGLHSGIELGLIPIFMGIGLTICIPLRRHMWYPERYQVRPAIRKESAEAGPADTQ